MTDTILLVFALVCFALAALDIGVRVNLIALGLMCWVATLLF